MAAFVENARQHEEAAGGDSVRQHDEDGPVQTSRSETEDSKDDESEMADRRIGDQLFHVRLHQRDQRAIDNADQRQHHNPGRVAVRLFRKKANIETQQAVGAHLQQNAGEQHRSGGGRFHVRVGQPGVKKPRKSQSEAVSKPRTLPLRIAFWMTTKSKLPVFAYSHRIAASINIEPMNVNRKYFTAA